MEFKKFDKTIIPFALVGYEIVIANSYPTRAHGIIVNYSSAIPPYLFQDLIYILNLNA